MNNEFYGNIPYQDMNYFNDIMLNNINNNSNKNILGSYDGYIKGNMFNDIYKEYRNYKPIKLIPNNEQAEILLNLDQICFALNDIRLYLDVNPEDTNMINKFNKYNLELKEVLKRYEEKYGPITSNTLSNNNIFNWEAYSFPWEMEEM